MFVGDINERGVFRPRATGFVVGVPSSKADRLFAYLVTAQHVVVGLTQAGKEIYCRINTKDGGAAVEPLRVPRWWYHPDPAALTDVAVAALHLNFDLADQDCIPLYQNPPSLSQLGLGLGDETVAIGLFTHHAGKERNVPILRIGNLVGLPEEPVRSRWGDVTAYLVEMRSIGGLSGSPVFLNKALELPPGGFIPDPRFQRDPEQVMWGLLPLLGLVHGHFDVPNLAEDSVVEDDAARGSINTGIGVVVPVDKIIETLYQPDLAAERAQIEAVFDKEEPAATPDEPEAPPEGKGA